jgi:agmatinase
MKTCFDFLGDEVSGEGEAQVYIVPVPIEMTTSYIQGTDRAPRAIIEASRQIELYNSAIDLDLEHTGIVTVGDAIRDKDELFTFIERYREQLLGSFTCFIGGEHSITPWILEALGIEETGIVWLDAHADLREEYLGDSQSHACAARNSLRFGSLVEIGVRSYSKEEHEFLSATDDVRIFRDLTGEAIEAVRSLPANIYLSIDYDAFDPSIIPAVGTPEPGGLTWARAMECLDFLFSEKRVVAMDAVELCPAEGGVASDFIAAKVIYEAISRFLQGGGLK